MPISVSEWFKSRPTREDDDPTIDLIFKIVTTGDERGNIEEDLLIKAELDRLLTVPLPGGIPAVYDGLIVTGLLLNPVTVGVWTATISYGLVKRRELGDTTVRITTTGGTHHITQGIDTAFTKAAPGHDPAPDVNGIGDQGKGRVAGVDVQIPAFGYNVTTELDPANVTTLYIKSLYLQTATVNNAPFKIFARGEALFMGATLVQNTSERFIQASFAFIGSVNATDLAIGDITGIVKEGHQYLWTRYRTDEDAAAKTLVEKPIAAYVEQVYPYSNFATIGIGV